MSVSNSLVGSFPGDNIGRDYPLALPNGNYVISSPKCQQGGVAEAGAITWGNGVSGTSGVVNVSNSLVGSHTDDLYNNSLVPLTNGNYLVRAQNWDNGSLVNVGAVTWCNGLTGIAGQISASNSLIGNSANDGLGGAYPLSNGNYVVSSSFWDNGSIREAGMVMWCNGNTGAVGNVNPANAIIGTQTNGHVGAYITPLSNGHYVISSPDLDNGAIPLAGAVTWADGTRPTRGNVDASNSILGNSRYDFLYQKIVPLTNGNYVIGSSYWNNGGTVDVGSATWRNGFIPSVGSISAANSLIGSSENDLVGYTIVPLTNGNYVVGSQSWKNGSISGAGAVTWGNGSTGTSGYVSVDNSLVGSHAGDAIGFLPIAPVATISALANGNYVVDSPYWNQHRGAVTLGIGTGGTIGTVDASNSLVGDSPGDNLGYSGSSRLNNGDYIVRSLYFDDGLNTNAGAATLGNGSVATTGFITRCNSVIGSVASGYLNSQYNDYHNYLIVGLTIENSLVIFKPITQELAMVGSEANVNITGNEEVTIITRDCQIMAAITPNGAAPLAGELHAQVWIEGTVPSTGVYPFVARHYQITPEKNTATARVTLYFTHKNFLEFNNHPNSSLNLPASPGDATGISNLRIEKFAGKSNNGTGLPDSYTEGSETIDPENTDIIWNAGLERWEVSFDVNTGFSGFIAHTYTKPLPVRLVSFKGQEDEQSAVLKWEVADASNFSHFLLERSTNARQFETVSKVDFLSQNNHYTYNDSNASNFANAQNQTYYRLKMIDLDGTYAYSQILNLQFKSVDHKFVYPNPFSNQVSISFKNNTSGNVQIRFIDAQGKVVFEKNAAAIDNKIQLTNMKIPAGPYVISVQSGSETVNLKGVKEK